ncbi:unnamed protein product [Colias eurytheme]|nr:unnamed protein product [Colias eurytheme]
MCGGVHPPCVCSVWGVCTGLRRVCTCPNVGRASFLLDERSVCTSLGSHTCNCPDVEGDRVRPCRTTLGGVCTPLKTAKRSCVYRTFVQQRKD